MNTSASSRRVGKLWTWHRWAVYLILTLCAVTGLLWFVLRDVLSIAPNSNDRIVLVLHGVSSFLALMAFGSVLPTHVRVTWKANKNRMSGLLVVAMLAVLSLTALVLYYGSEEMHMTFKWTHIVIGLGAFACFPLHVVLGKISKKTQHADSTKKEYATCR